MLHVLLHMAHHEGSFTSEQIAGMLGTNGAVVRRTLGGLREAGLVRAEKGHHGGWTIARNLADITLLDIYRSVGTQQIFTIGSDNESPTCAVEASVNSAVADILENAERQLMERFSKVTLADLSDKFNAHWASGTQSAFDHESSAAHLGAEDVASDDR